MASIRGLAMVAASLLVGGYIKEPYAGLVIRRLREEGCSVKRVWIDAHRKELELAETCAALEGGVSLPE